MSPAKGYQSVDACPPGPASVSSDKKDSRQIISTDTTESQTTPWPRAGTVGIWLLFAAACFTAGWCLTCLTTEYADLPELRHSRGTSTEMATNEPREQLLGSRRPWDRIHSMLIVRQKSQLEARDQGDPVHGHAEAPASSSRDLFRVPTAIPRALLAIRAMEGCDDDAEGDEPDGMKSGYRSDRGGDWGSVDSDDEPDLDQYDDHSATETSDADSRQYNQEGYADGCGEDCEDRALHSGSEEDYELGEFENQDSELGGPVRAAVSIDPVTPCDESSVTRQHPPALSRLRITIVRDQAGHGTLSLVESHASLIRSGMWEPTPEAFNKGRP